MTNDDAPRGETRTGDAPGGSTPGNSVLDNDAPGSDARVDKALGRRRWLGRLRGNGTGSSNGSGSMSRPVWRQPVAIAAAAVVVGWLLLALFAPLIAPYDPLSQEGEAYTGPSGEHLFGTDELGRDILSRVIHGARLSIPLALAVVVLALAIGGLLGLLAGYIGRGVDEALMRLTDLVFAFPQIILAMAVTAAFGPSTRNAVLALVIVSWPVYARVIRSAVLSIRGQDYLYASRLLGVGPWRALRRDVVPNSVGPAVVLATLELGNAVLMLAALSFLGLGPRPPAAEWGAMIALGSNDLSMWWVSVFPGLAILTVVLSFNLLGDALRDWLDPRHVRRG